MTPKELEERRYATNQERPYIRKIGKSWVASGGVYVGMTGYTTWERAMADTCWRLGFWATRRRS